MQQKSTKPKKIAIFTSSEGHLSISESIEDILKKEGYKTKVFYTKDPLFSLYTPLYRFIPQAVDIPFTLGKHQRIQPYILEIFKYNYHKKLLNFCKSYKPDLLINTYFMYNPSLEEIKKEYQLPLINIITDPKSIHQLIISTRADLNFEYDHYAHDAYQKLCPDTTIKESGWFVRSRFQEPYNKQAVRKKLKLETNKLTFLIASGSEGTTMVLKVLPFVITRNIPLQIIVACGGNNSMKNGVQLLQKFIKNTKSKTNLISLGFTKDIHQYMQAADLVIGKAGPNTLFETIATLTPFFAITHIAGQETGNLDIIREKNLGIVEENPVKIQKKISQIIQQPELLDQYLPDIKKEAEYNRQAASILLTEVKKLLEK